MKPIVVDMSIPMDVQALVPKSGGETELFHPSPQLAEVDLCQAKLGCEMISSDVFLSEEAS